MKLHHREIGQGKPLFILHGLFGSSDNWQSLGKKFGKYFRVYFVDQRNHGRSPHSDDFDYPLMVQDFHELVSDLGVENINLVGHSMGGKTAIGFASQYPELVKKMVVVDISHKGYPRDYDQIIGGMKALDLNLLKSRGQADMEMAKYVEDWRVRQFLLKNLYWVEKGKLDWRINLPILSSKISNILEEIPFQIIETDTLFIRGEKSNYILASDYDEIGNKFPFSQIQTLEEAGHWVHSESPDEFYKTVLRFLL